VTSLEASSGFKLEINIVINNKKNYNKYYTYLADSGKTTMLCWIPSHVSTRAMRGMTVQQTALSIPITNI